MYLPLTIQAATEAALNSLLVQHELLISGESGIHPAPGVRHSHISGTPVVDGVPLEGSYALLAIDGAVFGEDREAQLRLDLAAYTYEGPEIRQWFGGAAYAPDIAQQIRNERDRRIHTSGYKVGANWFHSDQTSRIQQIGLVMMGASIPAGLQWKTMGGAKVTMTPTLAQQVFAAAAVQDATHHAVSDAAIAAAAATPNFDLRSIAWPEGFVATK